MIPHCSRYEILMSADIPGYVSRHPWLCQMASLVMSDDIPVYCRPTQKGTCSFSLKIQMIWQASVFDTIGLRPYWIYHISYSWRLYWRSIVCITISLLLNYEAPVWHFCKVATQRRHLLSYGLNRDKLNKRNELWPAVNVAYIEVDL